MGPLRAIFRLCALCVMTSVLYTGWLITRLTRLISQRLGERTHFLFVRAWARSSCAILGIRVTVTGSAPKPPFFMVSNHLSYLDVIVLMSCIDCFFLSKAEVASMPFIGFLARSTGTLFIDRNRKSALPAVISQVQGVLARERGVVVFPEGTSSRGDSVLRFRASLFEVAIRAGSAVSTASLTYSTDIPERPADLHVCWWGDMPFASHFFALAGLSRIDAGVNFAAQRVQAEDRKELARLAQLSVEEHFTPVVAVDDEALAQAL